MRDSNGYEPRSTLPPAKSRPRASELQSEGLAGVNGPPGTGKTTLLRDLVAAVVVQRAEAMVGYDDPEKAFTHRGQMKVGAGFVHMYSLASDLEGYEMLVASSNNKAVENISMELPGLEALARDLPPPRYYRTTSDATAGERLETWGLIAAVLGNKANQSVFRRAFWQDDDTSLKSYLKEAAGQPVRISDPDDPTAPPREPRVVQDEKPPRSHGEALQRWRRARRRLRSALTTVRKDLEKLEELRRDLQQLPRLEQARLEAAARHDEAAETLRSFELKLKEVSTVAERLEKEAEKSAGALTEHRSVRPSLLSWLFRTKTWKSWNADILGASKWISVKGSAADKWCPEEGEAVIGLLRQITRAGNEKPDIYVISPFRVVAERMRERLRQAPELLGAISDRPGQWIFDQLGTVHTFQGKEAEAVILLLGAPLPEQRGARSWAGGRPNLVNVAVTRAKSALYVIGNRELWRQHGFFQTLDRFLP